MRPWAEAMWREGDGNREEGADCDKTRGMLSALLRPGLRVVFCGSAVSSASAGRGHYYAGRGNQFGRLLHDAGFTPTLLTPAEDAILMYHGIGITDLIRDVAQSHDRGLDFGDSTVVLRELATVAPAWVAFNGLKAGQVAARASGPRSGGDVSLGQQAWRIGASRTWVLPSSSAANTHMRFEEKLAWWTRLRQEVRASNTSEQ